MNIIEVKNLTKSYGPIHAVDGLSFTVREGEIFGLLGPNGAGKTTTLEIIEGLKRPEGGEIQIFGLDASRKHREIRERVGIVLQRTGFLPNLTLWELLELFSSFYRKTASLDHLIEKFSLESIISRYYHDLSGGQRQRFVLAVALLHKPDLLFLDEPTVGLDPAVRQHFWEIISSLRKDGMTIVLTTHYMEEAQLLCDRVGVVDHGKILVTDRPVKLISSLGVVSRISFMSNKPIDTAALEALPGVQAARRDRYIYELETQDPETALRQLLEWERDFSGKIFNLEVRQATLEDVFLKLTGHSLRE